MLFRVLRSSAFRMGASRLLNASSRPVVASRLARAFSVQSSLAEMLEREYKEETQPEKLIMDEELQEVHKVIEEEGWKIVDEDSITKMFRNTDKFNVQVSFHCQDQVRGAEEEEDERAGDDDEEPHPDMDEFTDDQIRFSVTATPVNGGKTLYFSCLSQYAVGRIEGISTIEPDNIDKVHSSSEVFENKAYHGPDFSELAEDVMEGFQEFLMEDLGVNTNVAAFVAMYADHKEQELYTSFLKETKSILAG